MAEVVNLFPANDTAAMAVVADTPHNRECREDQGPPVGETAWMCTHCEDFAFYVTRADIRCYRCHTVQSF